MAIEVRRRNQHRCDKGHRWITWSAAWKECSAHPCPKCSAPEPEPVAQRIREHEAGFYDSCGYVLKSPMYRGLCTVPRGEHTGKGTPWTEPHEWQPRVTKPEPECSHITKTYANESWWRYCPHCGVAMAKKEG